VSSERANSSVIRALRTSRRRAVAESGRGRHQENPDVETSSQRHIGVTGSGQLGSVSVVSTNSYFSLTGIQRRLKIYAATTGQPIQVIVESLISDMLDQRHVG